MFVLHVKAFPKLDVSQVDVEAFPVFVSVVNVGVSVAHVTAYEFFSDVSRFLL